MVAAQGIVKTHDKSLLKEHGGPIDLSVPWANSFLRRHGHVKLEGTKPVKHLPSDFDNIKSSFLTRTSDVVQGHEISADMIVNFDQMAIPIILTSEWTLEVQGAKQVSIIGLDDKRQITSVISGSPSGRLPPLDLIYQGKTSTCHPTVTFAPKWHITHNETHWSNTDTMRQYIKHILGP